MAAVKFAENYYSYRNVVEIFEAAPVQSADHAVLAAIDAKMVEAR